jgi:hypothetical protein
MYSDVGARAIIADIEAQQNEVKGMVQSKSDESTAGKS